MVATVLKLSVQHLHAEMVHVMVMKITTLALKTVSLLVSVVLEKLLIVMVQVNVGQNHGLVTALVIVKIKHMVLT